MYQHLIGQLIVDFNGGSYSIGADGSLNLNDSDINNNFISGMHWNYKNSATGISGMSETTKVYRYNGSTFTPTDIPLVIDKMSSPADYGQVMIVQLRVGVYQPLWGWSTANGKYEYNGEDGTKWVRNATGASTEFVYNYYVPCLQYKTTNQ